MIRRIQTRYLKGAAAFALAAFVLATWSPGSMSAPQSATPPAGQRTFYASHSLMWDVPPVLQQEAEAYGIKGHAVLGIQRIGGSPTSAHWNLPDNQNQAKQALQTGNVDAFVMSPIQLPDEAIDNFVKLGLKHNPNMKFFVQVSWPGLGLVDNNDFGGMGGGGGGFGGPPAGGARGAAGPGAFGGNNFVAQGPPQGGRGGGPGALPGGQRGGFPGIGGGPGGGAPGAAGGARGGGGQDYNKTPEELAKINIRNDKDGEAQAAKLNKEIGKQVVFLVPSSQAHNALRLAIYKKEMPGMTDQGEVFLDFIGHPTAPVVALNTYVHFAVMYKRSPIGLPMPNVLKNANRESWRSEALNKKLQEIAWNIVSQYPPSGVTATAK